MESCGNALFVQGCRYGSLEPRMGIRKTFISVETHSLDRNSEMFDTTSKSYSMESENDSALYLLGKRVVLEDETHNGYNAEISRRKKNNLCFKKEESNEEDTRNQPSWSDKKIFPLSWRELENSSGLANSASATIQTCISNSAEFLT